MLQNWLHKVRCSLPSSKLLAAVCLLLSITVVAPSSLEAQTAPFFTGTKTIIIDSGTRWTRETWYHVYFPNGDTTYAVAIIQFCDGTATLSQYRSKGGGNYHFDHEQTGWQVLPCTWYFTGNQLTVWPISNLLEGGRACWSLGTIAGDLCDCPSMNAETCVKCDLNGCGVDIDGDGIPNCEDSDIDNDGVANGEDTDPCRVPQTYDPDSCEQDWDNDGTANCDDSDDDGDGIDDEDEDPECAWQIDCDGDGVPDGDEPPGCEKTTDCDGDGDPDGEDPDPECDQCNPARECYNAETCGDPCDKCDPSCRYFDAFHPDCNPCDPCDPSGTCYNPADCEDPCDVCSPECRYYNANHPKCNPCDECDPEGGCYDLQWCENPCSVCDMGCRYYNPNNPDCFPCDPCKVDGECYDQQQCENCDKCDPHKNCYKPDECNEGCDICDPDCRYFSPDDPACKDDCYDVCVPRCKNYDPEYPGCDDGGCTDVCNPACPNFDPYKKDCPKPCLNPCDPNGGSCYNPADPACCDPCNEEGECYDETKCGGCTNHYDTDCDGCENQYDCKPDDPEEDCGCCRDCYQCEFDMQNFRSRMTTALQDVFPLVRWHDLSYYNNENISFDLSFDYDRYKHLQILYYPHKGFWVDNKPIPVNGVYVAALATLRNIGSLVLAITVSFWIAKDLTR